MSSTDTPRKHHERVLEQERKVSDMELKLNNTLLDFKKIQAEYIKSIEQQNTNITKAKRTLEILKHQQKLLENLKQLEEQIN
jgi:hypothetical protein